MTKMTRKWSSSGTGQLTQAEQEARRLEKKGVFNAELSADGTTVAMTKDDFKHVMEKLGSHKRTSKNLLYTLVVTGVAAIVACGVLLGIVMSANELSKESHVK